MDPKVSTMGILPSFPAKLQSVEGYDSATAKKGSAAVKTGLSRRAPTGIQRRAFGRLSCAERLFCQPGRWTNTQFVLAASGKHLCNQPGRVKQSVSTMTLNSLNGCMYINRCGRRSGWTTGHTIMSCLNLGAVRNLPPNPLDFI